MYGSWLEISRSAIWHNLAQFQRLVGKKVEVMPIIKSNAYGHGLLGVANLLKGRVKWFGVVNLDEALLLRANGIKNRIFVLSYFNAAQIDLGIKKDISLPIYNYTDAAAVSRQAKKVGKIAKIHVKIDTGTSRLGILPQQVLSFFTQVNELPNLKIEGVWSHFAASEENFSYTNLQLSKFKKIIFELEKNGFNIPYKHFACSAATLTRKDSYFNLIRLGVSLYGLWPSKLAKNNSKLKLKAALTWKTKIIQIKNISSGTKIGYGCTYTAKRQMKVAVLPVGYWEGYDRRLSNLGEVLIFNQRCRVVGRICMNLMMVDVTDIKNIKLGDEVILLGGQGRGVISAEMLAEKIGTINYEVVTRINPFLKRIYLK
ncbi:MAG: alanine racemase [Patescibacteria group bacterium]|nr:alanine racemase [Patescibacteria group bacterium]